MISSKVKENSIATTCWSNQNANQVPISGIIFPPDENGLIKLCSCRALTNFKNKAVPGASVLHSLGDYPDDGCPKEIEDEIRSFVREMIPELADRPFISTKLCW